MRQPLKPILEPNGRLKPARTPKAITGIGRHYPFYEWLERQMRNQNPRRKIRILVAGIGGGKNRTFNEKEAYHPSEHLETALALHRSGVSFDLTVMDVDAQAMRFAREQLKKASIQFPKSGADRSNTSWQQYTTKMGPGARLSESLEIILPEKVKNAITLQGPGIAGDVTSVHMPQGNDLVSIMNLAFYFAPEHHDAMAEKLITSMRHGAYLVTNSGRPSEDTFVRAIVARLGKGSLVHQSQADGKQILVFRKDETKMKKAAIRSEAP